MSDESCFGGFPIECVQFYKDLRENNNKPWFDEHRAEFEKYVMEPARDFVREIGQALTKISPGIIADTRYNQSIFRPFRDTRFSKDKTPYKRHLGIFFWEGHLPKMDCSGFYFHLEPPMLMLAAGNHCFSKPILNLYRESVVDPKYGKDLSKVLLQIQAKGDYEIGEKQYKQVPRGYDKNHENAELLLFGGLTVWTESAIPTDFYSSKLVSYCLDKFKDLYPIHKWLLEMTGRIK
ncbi:MAG: DUF2461 domain-containing protein [Deltaproteobacteria bacterium]|nr:DUF2461 domain-containing protein [Deltaproteobacteria bacterium]